jgi:hypothetical protein
VPISSCDENRLRIAQEAEQKLAQARQLAASGENEEALECYLFAFDNGRFVDGWGGVRLSYIPSEIAQLGQKYPLALEALRQRRDTREKMISEGETDFDVVSEWTAINQYLRESNRELEVLAKLQKSGKLVESVKERIIDSNFDQLLREKRYDVLGEFLNDFGRSFFHKIFHYEDMKLFPKRGPRNWDPATAMEHWKGSMREEGAQVFEVALGANNERAADEIARRLLLHCNDVVAYGNLLHAAFRAGKKKKAHDLLKQAKGQLSKEDYDKL